MSSLPERFAIPAAKPLYQVRIMPGHDQAVTVNSPFSRDYHPCRISALSGEIRRTSVEVLVNKRVLRKLRVLGIAEEATSAEYKITSRMRIASESILTSVS
ncbi:hypothetical protein J6590_067778, partial [Homalodisca vitripennis]